VPAMSPYRDYVDAGGLMAYTVDLAELLRRLAVTWTKSCTAPNRATSRFIKHHVPASGHTLKTANAPRLLCRQRCSPRDEVIE